MKESTQGLLWLITLTVLSFCVVRPIVRDYIGWEMLYMIPGAFAGITLIALLIWCVLSE